MNKPTTPTTTTAFIYLRVSSDKQARSGLGIAAQRERCLAMATVKGWTVPPECIFIDGSEEGGKGVTGTISERVQLDRLLAMIKKEPPAAVIISSLDRLGRRRKIIESLIEEIGENTDLVSCKESFDTTTAAGRFVLNIFMDLAELERDTISERTCEGIAALKARGMQYATLPYGFTRGREHEKIQSDGSKRIVYELTPNPAEQEVIALVKGLRQKRISIKGIADELNARKIPTRKNTHWHKTQIIRILNTETEAAEVEISAPVEGMVT
jgi:DNA invertase Pin-like site-specific DNA recombinase